jgi:alkaline phosphatase
MKNKKIKTAVYLTLFMLLLIGLFIGKKHFSDEQNLYRKMVNYESEFWFKRSLSHVLLNRMNSNESQVLWATTYHTAAPVPLGAVGPQKYIKKLQGLIQNDSLGRVLKEAVSDNLNVILVIGDGMGNMHMALPIYKRYAEANPQRTYFEKIMAEGACGYLYTSTARGLVTGSAASGTAIATGSKTLMNMVGVDSLGNKLVSALELAKTNGYTTAIVSDAGITDATPAAFYAHSVNRDFETDIAGQLVESNLVDIILGGGGAHFIAKETRFSDLFSGVDYPNYKSKREDDVNLFKQCESNGYKLCFTLTEMNQVNKGKVMGLFDGGGLPPAIENKYRPTIPSVYQMAKKALQLVNNTSTNSFTMIECARIDWESHDNDIVSVYEAVEEMNDVLEVAYQYYEKSPGNTLLVFTSDHETGGLEIAYKKVDNEHKEYRHFDNGEVWENNTCPLLFKDYCTFLKGQNKTLSNIISNSKTVDELKYNLENHAHINLSVDEAELLFYSKNGYQKYKNE